MKNTFFSKVKNYRYERKFLIEGLTSEEVEGILKFHPEIFKEIYYKRIVNSIYFDSFDLQYYSDNVMGVDRRLKVRIRWYGNLFGFIESPTLEIKLKHNLHVGKLLYPLKSFTLDKSFSIDVIYKLINESSLSEALRMHLMPLKFSLLNSYTRKYFLSSNKMFRVTVDVGMQAYKLLSRQNNFLSKSTDYNNIILELKYNKPYDKFVESITSSFPFRMTKSSKYVEGIQKTYI